MIKKVETKADLKKQIVEMKKTIEYLGTRTSHYDKWSQALTKKHADLKERLILAKNLMFELKCHNKAMIYEFETKRCESFRELLDSVGLEVRIFNASSSFLEGGFCDVTKVEKIKKTWLHKHDVIVLGNNIKITLENFRNYTIDIFKEHKTDDEVFGEKCDKIFLGF